MNDQAKLPSHLIETFIHAKNQIPRTDSYVFAYFEDKNEFYEEYIAAANKLRGIHLASFKLFKRFYDFLNDVNEAFKED